MRNSTMLAMILSCRAVCTAVSCAAPAADAPATAAGVNASQAQATKATVTEVKTMDTKPKTAGTPDWDGIEVPASAGANKKWELLPVSDSFDYEAKPDKRPQEFTKRWKPSFINAWLGPGLTEFSAEHSVVANGKLTLNASRKAGTKKVYAGVISSQDTFTYPLYIEAKSKLSGLVLASNVWMLSDDSTQEIDVSEAYGSQRPDQKWFADRMHLSHHVFIREPFQDYQPTGDGTWFHDGTNWQADYHRIGVYWRDPFHLEYYVDGKLVRTVSGADIIDPKNYTKGTGLNKPLRIIIDTEDHTWRSDKGIFATDEELADPKINTYNVDWIRVYQAVPEDARE